MERQCDDWTNIPMEDIPHAAQNRPSWRRISVSMYRRPSFPRRKARPVKIMIVATSKSEQ
ncbi:hypothetical protein DPMN_045667 [Dreissena polymorpha]|uniref:Uncharacterized protein n=1 Tax=Dreissena polymorpha TaxID=45954 RepID=A0A9D4D875_DREPO|nr:hypothetical protein DPMN_045667 [Dreissena polymorpha]